MNRKSSIRPGLAAAVLAVGIFLSQMPFAARDQPTATAAEADAVYQCAMHPEIVAHEPGNCPICGMRLERRDVGETPPATAERGDVPGRVAFRLSPERVQRIGVRTGRVETRELETKIRAVGTVAYDRELYQALQEFRGALASKRALAGVASPDGVSGAEAIVRASRLRLRQLGVAEAELGTDPEELLLPGKNVWVYARIYESEAELIRPGLPLSITSPSALGRTFSSTVTAVDPVVDEATRTIRVRSRVESAGATLRPGSFVDVEIHVRLGRALAIAEEAIVETGERSIAFVVDAGGRFEPRVLTLGREAGDHREVLHGVAEGESVVTSANFLIDSESRFRSAVAAFTSAPPAGHVH